MLTANYTELRNNLKGYMDSVIANDDTLVVHRGQGDGAVIISLKEYNAIKETEYIRSSPAMMEIIRKGDMEIAQGRGREINVDEL